MMLGKGEVTLVGGIAKVRIPRLPLDAVVVLSRMSALGTLGELSWAIIAKDSFTITSLNVLDKSVVRWAVFS